VILSTALKSAEMCELKNPKRIECALRDLNEVVGSWRGGADLRQELVQRGWRRSSSHVSQTVRGKHGARYTFPYQGARRLFEHHITIGAGNPNSCASIHFLPDYRERKIVIGYVGKHLPNTKT